MVEVEMTLLRMNEKKYKKLTTLLCKNGFIYLVTKCPMYYLRNVNKKSVDKILLDVAKEVNKELEKG